MSHIIEISKLAYGGEGIGHLAGKVCFVQGALPGEEVEAEILQDKKSFVRAKAVQILKPSPLRREPPCPYVEACGGCQYQHVDYAEELKWKDIQVREYLTRNLKVSEELIRPIVGAASPYHYRNSVTVHRAENDASGFFSEDNHTVTPVAACLLADERLQPAFQTEWGGMLKKISYKLSQEGKVIRETSDEIFPVLVGETVIETTPKSFFQNNLEMTAKIGAQLSSWVAKARPVIFVDLYAGVGTFSVLAAKSARKIVAVEDSRHSQPALRRNLEKLGIEHEILNASVESIFPRYASKNALEKPFVFMDPPRVGMMTGAVDFLAANRTIESLAYLSCHLGSLTRDLGVLLKSGHYQIREVIPFDMFPRTKHIEILVLLKSTPQIIRKEFVKK